jgi:RNA 2',3'-cyclic 3'-phosphodiesterase
MNVLSQNKLRLFIAFELPATAKSRLAQILTQLNNTCAAENIPLRTIKWVNSESIHLTNQFLGDTERSRVKEIEQVITDVHHQSEKRVYDLQSKTIGAFPNLNRPRVIWADLSGADLARMKHVTCAITQRLVEIQCLSDSKPFKPHLTLGRIRNGSALQSFQALAEAISFEPIRIAFDTLTLFASELTPKGPIYTGLHSWRFSSSEVFD